VHGIIVGRRVGYKRVVFVTTANNNNQKKEDSISAESTSHGGSITNDNAIYYELLPYL
jgi:hypothetical protein